MDLTEDRKAADKRYRESKVEESKKRLKIALEYQAEEDERTRRIYCQSAYNPLRYGFQTWRQLPEVLPRFYVTMHGPALIASVLDTKIHEYTGIPFYIGSIGSECEHARWTGRDDDPEFTLDYAPVNSAFGRLGIGFRDWHVVKQDFPDIAKLYSGFTMPVVHCLAFQRFLRQPDLVRILDTKSYSASNISPSTPWDIIRDSPGCTTMRVVIIKSREAKQEVVEGVEPVTEEEDAKLDKEVKERASNPPNPWYILEETKGGRLADSNHLRLFIQDLVVSTPRALEMAKTLKGLGRPLPLAKWAREFAQRRKIVSPKCSILPSPELKFQWPWNAKNILELWPVQFSVYFNVFPGGPVNQAKITKVINSITTRIQGAWSNFTKPNSYVDNLGFSVHRMKDQSERKWFYESENAKQEQADDFAKYMYFPEQSRQFHLVLEFGFDDDLIHGSYASPYNINNLTAEFMPNVLIPPSPEIAFYKKLDKQGQLLRIRCFPPEFHHYNLEGIHYRFRDVLGETTVEFDGGDDDVINTICLRIMRAQFEQVRGNLVLEGIAAQKPQIGLDQVNPLIRSFLGGKYCHNPGCDKESTVKCGHCDETWYCSNDCACKHWPKHQ